jgi:PmbA protein
MSCVLVAEQGDEKQRDYEFSTVRDAVDMLPIDSIASTAAKKTVQRLGSKPISTRTTPVIFSANLAKSVIGSLVAAVSGGNLYRQSSFLLDSLGTQVLPNWLNLTEKPHIKKALGSSAFDAEGVATKEQALVKQGILEHYVLGSYSARKLGLQTTANAGGVHNLIVDHSGLDFDELVKEMDTGFLVTELIGQGVNIVTGDYSRGAAGFWIEKGEIVQSVEEVTIAGNLKDMLLGIEKIADDVDMRGNIRCGSMLINQMQLAGK